QGLASRLKECVRPYDTVARLGGDEFTILMEDVGGEPEIFEVAERVLAALQRPIMVDAKSYVTSASLGIALSHDASDADSLLREADTAMYEAKVSGKGS